MSPEDIKRAREIIARDAKGPWFDLLSLSRFKDRFNAAARTMWPATLDEVERLTGIADTAKEIHAALYPLVYAKPTHHAEMMERIDAAHERLGVALSVVNPASVNA